VELKESVAQLLMPLFDEEPKLQQPARILAQDIFRKVLISSRPTFQP